ncbi:MAG: hypothetical protein AAF729_08000 [Pseudomonadota bacterium]
MRLFLIFAVIFWAVAALAQDEQVTPEEQTNPAEPRMTVERLAEIVMAIDEKALLQGNAMQLTLLDVPILVVTDPIADRMRAMVPIRSAEGIDPAELLRLMQANFDTALDARYAVAKGRLWGVFIHPLSPLEKEQFLSALAQTVNVARTYGQTYSGGAQVFGGGDSNEIYRGLLEDLLKKGEDI